MLIFACSAISVSEGGTGGKTSRVSCPPRDKGTLSSAALTGDDLTSSGCTAGTVCGGLFPSSRCRLFSRISSAESSAPSEAFPEGLDESGESLFRRKVNIAAIRTARIVARIEAMKILFAVGYGSENPMEIFKNLMHSPNSLSLNSMQEYCCGKEGFE